ncbi:MAG: hypothetical protein CMH98_00075 [Oceanospirillaceae bacterium]|nr:hypothetical protein [Oceanospirillaceae bacterium]
MNFELVSVLKLNCEVMMTTEETSLWRNYGLSKWQFLWLEAFKHCELIFPYDDTYWVITLSKKGEVFKYLMDKAQVRSLLSCAEPDKWGWVLRENVKIPELVIKSMPSITMVQNRQEKRSWDIAKDLLCFQVLPDSRQYPSVLGGADFYSSEFMAMIDASVGYKGDNLPLSMSEAFSIEDYQRHFLKCLRTKLYLFDVSDVSLPKSLKLPLLNKIDQRISEWSEWALELFGQVNPIDLGLDKPVKELALTPTARKRALATHGLNCSSWTRNQTYDAIKLFEAVGWLTHDDAPITAKGIGNAKLGARFRFTESFLKDVLQIPEELVSAYFAAQDHKKCQLVIQSYFTDRVDLMRLQQRQTGVRALHRKALKQSHCDDLMSPYHETVIKHLDSILGTNLGGRPKGKKKSTVEAVMIPTPMHIRERRDFLPRISPPEGDFLCSDYLDSAQIPGDLKKTLWFRAVAAIAEKYTVPFEMALQSTLGALSTACQRGIKVQVASNREPLPVSLFLLTLAEPGSGKTLLEQCLFSALRDKESERINRSQQAKKDYQVELDIWQFEYKQLQSDLKNAIKTGESVEEIKQQLREVAYEEPQQPLPEDFLLKDTTEEGLLKALQNRYSMGAVVSSEADKQLNGRLFRQASNLNDFWSGDPVRKDLAGSEKINLEDARLSFVLQTQPDSIRRLKESQRSKHLLGSGFLDRLLTIDASHIPSYLRKHSSNEENIETFQEHLGTLFDQHLVEKDQERVLTFTPEAQQVWDCFKDQISSLTGRFDLPGIKDFRSKIPIHAARIAALLHRCESDNPQIGVSVLRFAISLMQVYTGSYRRYYQKTPDPVEKAEKVLEKLMELYRKCGDSKAEYRMSVGRNEFYDKKIIKQPGDADEVLDLLIEYGAIYRNEQDGGEQLLYHPEISQGSLIDAYDRLLEKKSFSRF